MTTLADEPIAQLPPGATALDATAVAALAAELTGWTLRDNQLLTECKFGDFALAMVFVNAVAALAQAADHHPDIHINYSKVRLELSTHKVHGLTRNDFILAARISRLAPGLCAGGG